MEPITMLTMRDLMTTKPLSNPFGTDPLFELAANLTRAEFPVQPQGAPHVEILLTSGSVFYARALMDVYDGAVIVTAIDDGREWGTYRPGLWVEATQFSASGSRQVHVVAATPSEPDYCSWCGHALTEMKHFPYCSPFCGISAEQDGQA
jgi:hypothetical protein